MRNVFLSLSQFATFVMTAFGGFYTRIAPPQDSLRFWPGYASLVAGIVFIIITNIKHDKARFVILWISVLLALAFPTLYYMKYQSLTAAYGGSQVICGTVYTAKGADYTSKHPEKTKEEIIKDFAGQTAEIWTEDSISAARLILGLSYSVAVAFLSFAALTGLEQAKKLTAT